MYDVAGKTVGIAAGIGQVGRRSRRINGMKKLKRAPPSEMSCSTQSIGCSALP
jgi:hypothetical protein